GGPDWGRLPSKRLLIGRHELGRPRESGQRHRLESGAAKKEPPLSIPTNKALHVLLGPAHQMRSHSVPSSAPPFAASVATIMAILPVRSISILAIFTPAALVALMALVTSCCRNVEGARAIAHTPSGLDLHSMGLA